MFKLLTAYRANPTLKNAKRIETYDYYHTMAACMLLPDETPVWQAALAHAKRG